MALGALAEGSRFASSTGLNINSVADKFVYDLECLSAIIRAEPNSALAGVGRLPTTVIAHAAFSEMRSGALTMRISIDEIVGHSLMRPLIILDGVF
jgi:hypothetical protein